MNREIEWDWPAYLGRTQTAPDAALIRSAVEGRRVLITGAGGSIGSALAAELLGGRPACLLLCDSSEYALYEVYRRLSSLPAAHATRIVPVLGDVLQQRLLRQTWSQYQPDLIFHAAAYKHVPLLESNPFAALANNGVGTMRLCREVLEHGRSQIILLSTDKAVEPASMMGVSKRLAEMAVLSHSRSDTPMSVVRLCNVIESSGSVVPLFAEQLQHGVALTVTHAEVKRRFLTSTEAASALLTAAEARLSGLVQVPDCGEPVSILDLAHYMNRCHREQRGEHNAESTNIEIVGLRPGEKLVEALTWPFEVLERTLPTGMHIFAGPNPSARDVEASFEKIEEAIDSFDREALFESIAELVPGYPSSGDATQQKRI